MNPLAGVAVSGVGSLPHDDAAAAIELVARRCAEAPFWPQLPRRGAGEGMIEECLRDSLDEVPGFAAFAAALAAGRFAAARIVKGQLCGPLTLHRNLPAARALDLDACARQIARLAADGCARLARSGKPVLWVIDEPALSPAAGADERAAIRRVLDAIRARGATAGLHVCAALPAAAVADVDPDHLSFDAHRDAETALRAPELAAWLARGRSLGLGIVPTDPAEAGSAESMAERVRPLLRAARGSLVTASCGLGLRTIGQAERAFELAGEVAARLPREETRR